MIVLGVGVWVPQLAPQEVRHECPTLAVAYKIRVSACRHDSRHSLCTRLCSCTLLLRHRWPPPLLKPKCCVVNDDSGDVSLPDHWRWCSLPEDILSVKHMGLARGLNVVYTSMVAWWRELMLCIQTLQNEENSRCVYRHGCHDEEMYSNIYMYIYT